MGDNYVAIPATQDAGFVELARSQAGRLFKKQILRMDDSFVHPSAPDKKIHVDRAFAESLRKNFKAGMCDIVQIPLVDDGNRHVEDPLRNLGEVVDLSYDDNGVYVVMDVRKHAEEVGKTLLGASALMHLDYTNTATGEHVGPTLLHTAVTNRPYLTNLEGFEEIAALSADTSGESPVMLIPASRQENEMDPNEMISALKEHGIDVEAMQRQLASNDSELLTALSAVVAPDASTTLDLKDVAAAVVELAEENVALSNSLSVLTDANTKMLTEKAEAEVDTLIRQGRILPKARNTMVALSQSDRETFDSLVSDHDMVGLSSVGVDTFESPEKSAEMQKNIDRLADLANGK